MHVPEPQPGQIRGLGEFVEVDAERPRLPEAIETELDILRPGIGLGIDGRPGAEIAADTHDLPAVGPDFEQGSNRPAGRVVVRTPDMIDHVDPGILRRRQRPVRHRLDTD